MNAKTLLDMARRGGSATIRATKRGPNYRRVRSKGWEVRLRATTRALVAILYEGVVVAVRTREGVVVDAGFDDENVEEVRIAFEVDHVIRGQVEDPWQTQ